MGQMDVMESAPPRGRVTFLFTDVEGSTALWDRQPSEMRDAIAEHDRRIREVVTACGGYVFTTAGDSFAVAFAEPDAAVAAAVDAQLALVEPCGELRLRVRMGLHTGEASERDGDYFGTEVNRCARLSATAHGGQTVMSSATARASGALRSDIQIVDLGEYRLKDLAGPEHVFQVDHAALDHDFPPLRTPDLQRSNVPSMLSAFIGRQPERTAVRELLADHRLVSLVGPGGAGKTRLAVEIAEHLVDDFAHGVRFVDLTPITDRDVLLDEVARSVGASLVPGVPRLDRIIDALGARHVLLVLDNCEQIVEHVAELVAAVTSACERVQVLATSREHLDVNGEAWFRVPSMSVPSPNDSLEEATLHDSVRLFVERAQAVDPEFRATEVNLADIVSICRRLDGIPLAIELAAARLRVLTPAQVSERLDERFRLLATPGRRGSGRHRTLEATIDWSHDLLDDDERTLFRRLSVFAGSWSVVDAERVCGFGALDELDVADRLSGLIAKSMVVAEHGFDDAVRARLLESTREYARARLEAAAETDTAARRHLTRVAELAESLQHMLHGGRLAEALRHLVENADNVRAALRFGLDGAHEREVARIIGAIGYLWYTAGSFREGIQWCRELLERAPDLDDALAAAVAHSYGTLLGSWSDPAAGAEILRREVEIRRRLGDRTRLAAALNNLGNLLQDIGVFDEATTVLLEATDQYRAAGEAATLPLAALGYGELQQGGPTERAAARFDEAMREAVADGDAYGAAVAMANLGRCAIDAGDLGTARSQLLGARARFEELGVTPGVADADYELALVDRAEGRERDAARRLASSLVSPDAHWFQSMPYWIANVVASIAPDRESGLRLHAAALRHRAESHQPRPPFVDRELDRTHQVLIRALGPSRVDEAADRSDPLEEEALVRLALDALDELLGAESVPIDVGGDVR